MAAETSPVNWPAWIAGGSVAGGLALVRLLENQFTLVLPACPLHALTGLYCPGCGATRATQALLHGDLTAAWHFNALFVLSLPLLTGFLIQGQYAPRPIQGSLRLGWSILAVLVLFGVARNLPMEPFNSLAPH